MKLQVYDLKDLNEAAKQLLDFSSTEKIFLFSGDMGAGKTTLIKSLCDVLGVDDQVSSPTYSLVNEYEYSGGKIYHFDFFRVKTETEAYDMGFEEYLYSGNYCFIEWPEKIESLWPLNYIKVVIDQSDDHCRTVCVNKIRS